MRPKVSKFSIISRTPRCTLFPLYVNPTTEYTVEALVSTFERCTLRSIFVGGMNCGLLSYPHPMRADKQCPHMYTTSGNQYHEESRSLLWRRKTCGLFFSPTLTLTLTSTRGLWLVAVIGNTLFSSWLRSELDFFSSYLCVYRLPSVVRRWMAYIPTRVVQETFIYGGVVRLVRVLPCKYYVQCFVLEVHLVWT